ncbi:hypothetical protein E1B28_003970 [Marasmius oreades]|uniref:F-box domain-containing protein n=1 Tax=Marasmius oreades TaxID=181124 RepID=A0A9P7UXM8_9AGAR|nr:uncharacterized protein E1B28_003970 [Marasmius oreades]KAG7096547.1 hypothetical protein E1B28_003970 [Marasmius oreades]
MATMHAPCACPYCGSSSSSIEAPPTEVESLSKDNEPPSDLKRRSILQNLCQVQERLEVVANKIKLMEEAILVLSKERERLKEYARTYKTILNPVRCLPEMVLREIFFACIQDLSGIMGVYWHKSGNKRSRIRNSLNPNKPPWTLSQVCSTWRTDALSYSALWSYISISFPRQTSPVTSWNRRLSQLMLQLSRSRSHPLSVALQSHVPVTPHNPLLISVCSHAARWENLRLRFDDVSFNDVQKMLSPLLKGHLPNLRCLQWIVHRNIHEDSGTVFDTFEDVPNLVDLAIHPHHADLASFVRLPWSQITNYSAIRSRLSKDCMILLQMTNLSSLYIIDPSNLDGVPPLSLPSLIKLSVVARPEFAINHVGPLLESLMLENLQELQISADLTIKSLSDFVTRVAPTLRSFWLNVATMSHDAIIEVLEIIPGLTSLSIQHPTNHFIRALAETTPNGTPRLLPRLSDLRLFSAHEIDDMDSFADMVALRTDKGRYLQRLCFDDQFPVGPDDLRELRATGLDVLWFTPHWSATPFP